MDYRHQLIALAEKYAEAKGLSEARVANCCGCNGRFFMRLRNGAGCRVDTLVRVVQYFSDNWPDGCDWLDGINRPEKTKSREAA